MPTPDEIVLPDSIGQLPISSADPYLNELLIEYAEEALSRRKASRGSLRPDLENAIALLTTTVRNTRPR